MLSSLRSVGVGFIAPGSGVTLVPPSSSSARVNLVLGLLKTLVCGSAAGAPDGGVGNEHTAGSAKCPLRSTGRDPLGVIPLWRERSVCVEPLLAADNPCCGWRAPVRVGREVLGDRPPQPINSYSLIVT